MDLSIMEQLRSPFPINQVHWRVGATTKDKTKGLPLAYIDARNVMNRLDEVFGIWGWMSHIDETPSGRVLCELSCLINGKIVTKTDGAGDTGTEGEKGAISDALKRAAVQFGIGRYLYSVKMNWVEIDQYKKIIKQPTLPIWATPEGYLDLLKTRKENE